jgi:hypothetical protein
MLRVNRWGVRSDQSTTAYRKFVNEAWVNCREVIGPRAPVRLAKRAQQYTLDLHRQVP